MASDFQNKKRNRHPVINEIITNRYLYGMTIPGILFYFIFCYLPMFGLIIAFQEFNPVKGITGSNFIGWKNFDFFFSSDDWIKVTVHTLYLNALFIFTGLFVQITLSIMISEVFGKKFKKVTQSMMILPTFISWTIASMFMIVLFSTNEGFVNGILTSVGYEVVNFYQEASVWPFLLVILKLWKGTGYGTVIYLAAISGIDQEIYESGRIDGATRLQSILHITVPLLIPTTIVLFILSVGGIFYGDFGMIYALVGDNAIALKHTEVIDTFVFRMLRVNGEMGMSSAIGLFQSVMGFVMVVLANTVIKKVDKDAAIF